MGRVESAADARGLIAAMQEMEDAARAERIGIWASPLYAIRSIDQTSSLLNRFEIVEGQVLAADVVGGRVYLNFGPDWKIDFTVSIAPADARVFRREGIDMLALAGKRVRVRGWLRFYNGSVVDVTHPEQIELLGL